MKIKCDKNLIFENERKRKMNKGMVNHKHLDSGVHQPIVHMFPKFQLCRPHHS